jgi:UrcA family protein
MKNLLHHLVPAALLLSSIGLANAPAVAQDTAPRWNPSLESVIVSGKMPKNYRVIMSNTRLGEAYAVSASMEVPYHDLNLGREADATEFGRRIHVAAHLVCLELDRKYPPTIYPIVDGSDGADCERAAAVDGMDQANRLIAAAKG